MSALEVAVLVTAVIALVAGVYGLVRTLRTPVTGSYLADVMPWALIGTVLTGAGAAALYVALSGMVAT